MLSRASSLVFPHLAWFIVDAVGQMDLREFYADGHVPSSGVRVRHRVDVV